MISISKAFAIRRVKVQQLEDRFLDGELAPGLRLRVHIDGVDPIKGEENTVSFDAATPPYAGNDPDAARVAVLQAIIHEVDEHLLWDGERRWNPHRNDAPDNPLTSRQSAGIVEEFVPKSALQAAEARVRKLQMMISDQAPWLLEGK